MACNHKDFKGNLDLIISDLDIYCRKCNINFGKITMPVEWFNSSKYREGEIEIKQEFSFLLDLFKKEFEDYDVTILQYEQPKPLSNSDKRHFELISEINQSIKEVENTMENKDQSNIINTQAQKIASLQAENERLNKIVVGLSEMLINKTVGKSNNNTNIMLDIQTGGRE